MQARFIQDGTAVDYTPEADVAAGTVVALGDLVGITKADIPAGRLGALHLFGVFDVVKGDGAVTLGAKVYWDNTAKQATVTATGNKLLGLAVAPAEAGDAHVRVCIG